MQGRCGQTNSTAHLGKSSPLHWIPLSQCYLPRSENKKNKTKKKTQRCADLCKSDPKREPSRNSSENDFGAVHLINHTTTACLKGKCKSLFFFVPCVFSVHNTGKIICSTFSLNWINIHVWKCSKLDFILKKVHTDIYAVKQLPVHCILRFSCTRYK